MAVFVVLAWAQGAAADEATTATASGRSPVEPARIWTVLTDFARHPEIFPSTVHAAAEWLDPRQARVRLTTRVAGYTVSYTLAVRLDPEQGTLEGVLDRREPHDMEVVTTRWRVVPGAAGGSEVELRVRSRSGLPVPAWLEQRVTERTTRNAVRALLAACREPAQTTPSRVADAGSGP